MILKSQVEWALHCCAVLARLPAGRYLATKALAEFHGVPKEYLSKALQALAAAGIIVSTPGPTGGYRLARPAEALTFLDIVEAVDGGTSTFACNNIRFNNPCLPKDYCDNRPCSIARVMWKADQAWRDTLRSVTLADLEQTLNADVGSEQLQTAMDWMLAR